MATTVDLPASPAMPAPTQAGHGIERERARRFLISHWLILGVTALTMTGNLATGMVGPHATAQFFWMALIIGGMTVVGTLRLRAGKGTATLISAMLYIDSAVALVYFYLAGEFETPAMGLLTIPIIMAPVYARRRAVWGIAATQVVIYLLLMAGRTGGGMDWLPYGYMIDPEDVSNPQFVVLSIGAYITVTIAVAMLAGEASLDILTSRAQLQTEVARQTQALAQAKAAVERSNQELAQANDQLRASNLALAQFNAAISHDLRSPLQTLTLHLELLVADEPGMPNAVQVPPEARERLERVLTAAHRMGRMINDLQELARATTRLGELHPVDLQRLAGQVIDDLAARIERSQAHVQIDSPLPIVAGNIGLLRRVLQNLLENAIKYGGENGPRVRLGSLDAAPGKVAFYVEDGGPGIDSADHERIFELFRRLERDADREGTGAGLAIVARIVQAHGGEIHVESGRLLPGARFVVTLDAPR